MGLSGATSHRSRGAHVARAVDDVDAVRTAVDAAPDPVAGVAFAVATALLLVITGGMGYVALREALDRKAESDARAEEDRQARVIEANKGNARLQQAQRVRGKKLTPSQRAAMETEGDGGMNRRERRRRERAGESTEE
ncbi:unnamed product [Ostreococcus tauri]|uniref:Unnamed product n=1 Tax=Ostreococcus tauri TaxID=70448 RepID=A0A090M4I2_OSTTA|nr:unnamed product [Ostreococcus tauri]CEF99145.1 unnamed product [Ostreococcus tauri]|eukprot:XP_022839669.1 unnamed product [Ostreococcus tauri]